MNTVECRDCKTEYSEEQKNCPNCGSAKKTIYTSLEPSTLGILSEITSMRGKKKGLPKKKKIIWEWTNKRDVRGDNGRQVRVYRMIDREKDEYEERITDLSTGEVYHECKEALSAHQGHGSAKTNESKNK